MRAGLKKSVELDKRKKVLEIMPLSQIDAKIIEEIMYALKGIGELALYNIVNKYKEIKDKTILDELQRFNVEFDYLEKKIAKEEANESEEETPFIEKWIQIGNYDFKLRFITSIKRDNFYNPNSNKIEFRLVINEDPSGRLFHANTIIDFISEQAREYEYGMLRKKISFYSDTIFI